MAKRAKKTTIQTGLRHNEGTTTGFDSTNDDTENNTTPNPKGDIFQDEMLMYTKSTLPPELKKFWNRRYSLFSRYDEGVFMSSELWYSVTAEATAAATAAIIKHLLPHAKNVLDVCCGGGGNTIQFAQLFDSVGAVDINKTNVFCTVHNAEVYEVADKIWTVTGDWLRLANGETPQNWIPQQLQEKEYPFDFIFCSPPWGGMEYSRAPNSFNLDDMRPLSFTALCDSFCKLTRNFGLYLPKSSNMEDINKMSAQLYGEGVHSRVIQLEEDGYSRGLLVLFGPDMVAPIDYYDLSYHIEIEQQDPII